MDVISPALAKTWIAKLVAKLVDLRGKQSEQLRRIADEFGDPRELAAMYVEPNCQHFPPADEDENDRALFLRSPIRTVVDQFLAGPATHFRRHLFVLADAGMGKTSLLVMLKLTQLTQFWPSTIKFELMRLGESTLSDLLKLTDRSNTVLLLDALDEDPLAWGRLSARVEQILRVTQQFRRTIITCRTQFFNAGRAPYDGRGTIQLAGFDCPLIFNSLFDEKQTDSYIRNMARVRGLGAPWIRKARVVARGMGTLSMRPMLLSHLEDLVEDGVASKNEYGMYAVLALKWLNREQQKPRGATETPLPSTQDLWRACLKVAIELFLTKRQSLPSAALSRLIEDDPNTRHIEAIHVGGRSLLNKNSEGELRFSHYSIQEFFIVHAVVNNELPGEIKGIRATDLMISLFGSWRSSATSDQLRRADLTKFSLKGCSFRGKHLHDLNFHDLDLSDCDFSECTIVNVDFSHAMLTGASFRRSRLHRVNFSEARLQAAKFVDVGRPEGCSFRRSDLTCAWLQRSDLSASDMTGAISKFAVVSASTKLPTGYVVGPNEQVGSDDV